MSQVDFDAINSALMANILTHLSRWLPNGKQDGHEYAALNPTRADRNIGSFRINLHTGMWADFSTGDKGGDLVSLYAYLQCKGDQGEAVKALAPLVGIEQKRKPQWNPIVPATLPFPDIVPRNKWGEPVAIWKYHDEEGRLIGGICRFDKEGGGKEIVPLVCCTHSDSGKTEWRWQSFPKPRPLYGLPDLKANPDAYVIVVEGEKACDAARKLFPNQVCVSWPGGSKAVKLADFRPLAGRKVILWPDNDTPGLQAMQDIAALIENEADAMRFITPPDEVPEGWDLADAEWTPEQALEYLKGHMVEEAPKPAPPIYSASKETIPDDQPFRCLGFDRAGFYYLPSGQRIVICLSAAQHTQNHLLMLAPMQFWEREFPSKNGADWGAATNALMRWCEMAGLFTSALVRGRGAWFDNERIALHLGDKVIINNEVHLPHQVKSNYIYEAGIPMRATLDSPLSTQESGDFMKLCEVLPWDRPIYARYFAGWCVLAHIGGALPWRPHIWVTGRKGSGKTYIMTHILRPMLGDNCLFVQSESTSAGIRQTLYHDALPVMFEEAEGEDFAAMQRIQQVLALVRQSSSDTGGVIMKGTQTGKAMTFEVRSCFAFSSINAGTVQQSDRSRVTLLEVNQDKRNIEFSELCKMEEALITPDYVRRFFSRALSLADTIRKNAITFSRAVAAEFGEQRAGDQIGTLLAGAYSLHSRKLIDLGMATDWVKAQDWTEQRDEIKGHNDEQALWDFMRQGRIRMRVTQVDEEIPIGYLIEIAAHKRNVDAITDKRAQEMLMRNGFKTKGDTVIVSNNSPFISRLLRDTPWSHNWGKVLRRLPGAQATNGTEWFGYSGSEARGTIIPLPAGQAYDAPAWSDSDPTEIEGQL